MRNLIWIMGLWLLGISPVAAWPLNVAESLKYDVYWGFVRVGGAQLDYRPEGERYVVRAEVKDDSALIDLHDVWESRGQHKGGRAFVPEVYSIRQQENSYRADKTMTFDSKARQVVYVNHIDGSDQAEPLKLGDARDVLATVYAWRKGGLETVLIAATVPMVSLKKQVTLRRAAGVKTKLAMNGKDVAVWRVDLKMVKETGKPSKDSWTVYLSDDEELVPMQIVAATKFGTFKAVLAR